MNKLSTEEKLEFALKVKIDRFSVPDIEEFTPTRVRNYLFEHGWDCIENISPEAKVLAEDQPAEELAILDGDQISASVILPLDLGLLDYSARIYDIVSACMLIEERSPIAIMLDMLETSKYADCH